MKSTPPKVALSPLEEERFGVRCARALELQRGDLPDVIEYCRRAGVELLIGRVTTGDSAALQAAEEAGGRFMDTLVYYARDLARDPLPTDPLTSALRPVRPADVEPVLEIARQAFSAYPSHYRADPRLDPEKCDEVYVDWTRRSCLDRAVAREVLIWELEGAPAAFATLAGSGEEGTGVLFGVAPRAQGRGVYRALVAGAMEWFRERGARRMLVSTQITNLAVQKVWVRLGFEPSASFHTFHLWFRPG